MQSIQELRERLQARATEVRDLVEKNNEKWTPELQAKYDQAMAEIDDVKDQIKRTQAVLDAIADDKLGAQLEDAAMRAGARKKDNPVKALFDKWKRQGDNALNADEWSQIRNTMSTGTGSEGGYTVAQEVAQSVMDALKSLGGMRSVGTVLNTDQGNQINFPTSDGTAEEGEIIAENTSANDADPTFGTVALPTYKYSSKVVTVPVELLRDASVDLELFVEQRLVKRIDRITNKHFTVGTGTGQPRGITVAASLGKAGATGQTTTVIFDDLVDLVHSVDADYRDLGRCVWMMNDLTLRSIRKLKDTAGRPIFIPGYDGLAGSMPDTILGYPVVINNHMATMAANAKSILFGDFTWYVIRDVINAVEFQRYTDSAYAKKGQVGFHMWARSGGNWTDVGGAVKYYQNSAT